MGVPCESEPETINTLSSAQALIAGKDIRRQIGTGQIAHMDFGIGIRPGDGHKDGVQSWFTSQNKVVVF